MPARWLRPFLTESRTCVRLADCPARTYTDTAMSTHELRHKVGDMTTADQRVCICDDRALPGAAAEWIAMAVQAAVAERGVCTIALAGGATPRRTYEMLASPAFADRIPWSQVEIFFSDERAVPPTDEASNYRMAAESLLRRVPLVSRQIHRIEAEGEDLEAAAARFAAQLPDRLDVLLLGMGADGHVASLYPGSSAMQERERKAVVVEGPLPTRPRITLTPAAITTARRIGVIVAGAAKAGMVERVLNGIDTVRSVPARLARGATWLMDASAASRLSPRWCGSDVVLAADVGGTNARIALVDSAGGMLRVIAERSYPSRRFAGLADIVRAFAADVGPLPARACFAVACPTPETECRMPNLPWTINGPTLADEIGIPATTLINDFVAVGYAIPHLRSGDTVTLQAGTPRPGAPVAFLGAGTGLGAGFAVWDGRAYRVQPSEAGHADFAPQNARQSGLVAQLEAAYGHASCERVLSGRGIAEAYEYLASVEPSLVRASTRAEMARLDPAAVVVRRALDGSDALCREALDLFVEAFGAVAGNLALTVMATGGIYLAGGIAPRLVDRLASERFLGAFRRKGRLTDVLGKVPIHVITQANVGLLGAAAAALRDVDGS